MEQSRYEPVWQVLKTKGSVELVIIPTLAKRIVKAVKKRKNYDITYRFKCAEDGIITYLSSTLDGNKLTIYLRERKELKDRL